MKRRTAFARCISAILIFGASTPVHGSVLVLFANHSGANDPLTEGWAKFRSFTNVATFPVVNDAGLGVNAWAVDDNDGSRDGLYGVNLSASQITDAMTYGWVLRGTVRVAEDATPNTAVHVGFLTQNAVGERRFGFNLGREADGSVLLGYQGHPTVYDLDDLPNVYHSYELIYDPNTDTSDLFIDNVLRGSAISPTILVAPIGAATPNVAFGSAAGNDLGHGNYSEVQFGILDPNEPELVASPTTVNFGTLRYTIAGTNFATQNVRIDNEGTTIPESVLIGTANAPSVGGGNPASPSIEFTGTATGFSLTRNTLDSDPFVNVPYTFAPRNRSNGVAETAIVAITSNDASDPTVNVTLQGIGVGPVFDSTPVAPGGILDFGSVEMGTTSSNLSLSISNITGDGNLGALTGLTILGATLSGPYSSEFSLVGPTTAGPLQPGDPLFDIFLYWTPTLGFDDSLRNVTLMVQTDQGALLGQSGQTFVYNLRGQPLYPEDFTSVPEPSSAVVWGSVGLALVLGTWRRSRRQFKGCGRHGLSRR